MMCSYRVESSKGVNQSHYRHSMNTERNYVFYVTQIEKTHIICRTHFVYVSYLYKSYPRMHDMPRVTIVFGKVVDLNQGNEDIYIIVLYIQRSYLHCTKLHCKFTYYCIIVLFHYFVISLFISAVVCNNYFT